MPRVLRRTAAMVSTRSSTSASASASKASSASTRHGRTSRTKREPRSTTTTTGSSKFPYDLPYARLCLRTHPSLYRTGVGEQGVLMVEPYKSELLPHWRFKDAPTATASCSKLYTILVSYLDQGDFVGADMARKFIQMGYTRARRYANHKAGKKYNHTANGKRQQIARLDPAHQDPDKVEAASVFKAMLDAKVWANQEYVRLRNEHVQWAKRVPWPTEEADEVRKAILSDPSKQRVARKW